MGLVLSIFFFISYKTIYRTCAASGARGLVFPVFLSVSYSMVLGKSCSRHVFKVVALNNTLTAALRLVAAEARQRGSESVRRLFYAATDSVYRYHDKYA